VSGVSIKETEMVNIENSSSIIETVSCSRRQDECGKQNRSFALLRTRALRSPETIGRDRSTTGITCRRIESP